MNSNQTRQDLIEDWKKTREKLERSSSGSSYSVQKKKLIHNKSLLLKLLNGFVTLTGKESWQNKAKTIKKTYYDFHFDDLPKAFHNFRILHLSDLHLDCLPGVEESVSQCLNHQEFDLVLITGDLKDKHELAFAHIERATEKILHSFKSKHGVYCVLGNHDSYEDFDALEKLKVKVLLNQTIQITREQESIYLTGLDDVRHFYTAKSLEALAQSPHGFKILAVHSPDLAYEAKNAGYRLYLTGHTHGGQICLPWPIYTQGIKKAFASGPWKLEKLIGFTNRGVGTSSIPMRINCPAEVAIITLKKQSQAQP